MTLTDEELEKMASNCFVVYSTIEHARVFNALKLVRNAAMEEAAEIALGKTREWSYQDTYDCEKEIGVPIATAIRSKYKEPK